MARIRSVKPELFFDEELAELDIPTRYFFIGLFTQADREGKGEDRPKHLKANIYPYDEIDCESMMKKLCPKFITRYEVKGKAYYKINTFLKHQRPHHTEKDSVLPDITGKRRLKDGENPPVIKEEGKDITVLKEKGMEGIEIPQELKESEKEIRDWLAYKQERREGYKPLGLKALWRSLLKMDAARRQAAIEFSMARNYMGIFEPKGGNDGIKSSGVAAEPGKYARALAERNAREKADRDTVETGKS